MVWLCKSRNVLVKVRRWTVSGPEYGTGLAAWRGILAEAEQTSDLHLAIADSLVADVHASIKAWQKKNYHKSLMHFKETKDFEDGFKKVFLFCMSRAIALHSLNLCAFVL